MTRSVSTERRTKKTTAPAGSTPSSDTSIHTSWIHHKAFRYCYVFLLLMAWLTVRLFIPDLGYSLTIVHCCHCTITFFALHWVKGSPEGGAGVLEDNVVGQTFWEQIGQGVVGTPIRRFLSVTPILLFLVTVFFTGDEPQFAFWINLVALTFVVVPKSDALFGVRLFGVNAE